MKKLSFLTVVAGTMILASCSHDNEVVTTVDDNAVQQIVLQVASNGDGLTTRAGRELLSNEAAQDIQKVDLYVVSTSDKKIVYTKGFDWKLESTGYTNGKMSTLTLKGSDKLEAGNYKIYALGYYNEGDGSDYDIPNFTDGSTIENYVLEYKENKTTPEEIFAGSHEFTVGSDGNFSEAIVLHRQVAGAYIYVYNLPMFKELNTNCKIRLVASDYTNQLVLGKFQAEDHNYPAGTNVMYVVNGKKSGENYDDQKVVCEANISDWYSNIEEATDEEGNLTGLVDTKNWISSKTKSRKGGYVKGSIFASNFVMPFKNTDSQTLTLQIVDKDGKALRSWNVNLPDNQVPNALSYYDGSEWKDENVSETKNHYSIVRNHLYSIGTKSKTNPKNQTDPDDPDPDEPTPGPDPQEPQDLTVGQNLTLKVNHNWEVIYKMELE